MSLQHRSRGRPKGSGINDRQRLRDIATLIATQPQIKPTTAIKMLGEHDPSVIRRLRDKFYSLQHELMDEIRAGRQPSQSAGAVISSLPGSGNSAAIVSSLMRPSLGDGSVRSNTGAVGIAMMPRIGDASPQRPASVPFNTNPIGSGGTNMQADRSGVSYSTVTANAAQIAAAQTTPAPAPAPVGEAASAAEIEKAKLIELAAYNVMLGLAIQATVSAVGQQTRVYEETLRLPPILALLRQQIAIGELVMSMTWPAGQSRGDGRLDVPQPAAT